MIKVLDPITLSTAMLTASSVPEADHPAWVSGATYAVDDKAIRTSTHRIYQRQTAGAGTVAPELDDINWVDIGPTNRWAMFDASVSTTTVGDASGLHITLAPGRCNGLTLLDTANILQATVTCTYAMATGDASTPPSVSTEDYAYGITLTRTITYGPAGTVTLRYDISLQNRNVSNWSSFFLEPYAIKTDVFIGFTSRPDTTITLDITSPNPQIGALMVGNYIELGDVGYGISAGIDDYSVVTTDAYGTTTLQERDYTKHASYPITVENWAIRRSFSTLASLRAKPAVFIGSDDYRYTPFTVFGYVASFQLSLSFATYSIINVEVKGLSLA